ncbi:MAG: ArsI/CadI family heavy metal resistance metalloenzyme [Acidimicrobiales bacterium]
MSRVQLAINVADLDAAVAFYTKLLRCEPAKRRPGYANFAVASPPLKLVLIEGEGVAGTINHLGVEVDDSAEVTDAIDRFGALGLDTLVEAEVPCCYAVQDKVWVTDPDSTRWEIYTVLGESDTPTPGRQAGAVPGVGNSCCPEPADPLPAERDGLPLGT